MSFWKKILCAVLAVGLLGMGTTALAAENTQDNYADALHELGLFQGTNAGYELEKDLPREQAITLVVRFLGAEKEALEKNYQYPFADVPNWVAPYVGYAYANWITSGINVTTFGTGQLTTQAQYIVFMLRVLGYQRGEDFAWDEAKAFAEQIGLLPSGWDSGDHFTRGDAAELSWLTLGVKVKGGTETLADKLIKAGVFTADEYEFAQRVAEVGLAGAQEAEKPLPGNDDNSGSGGSDGGSGGSSGGSSSGSSGGSSSGSSGGSSGGNPDTNETEDIPLF